MTVNEFKAWFEGFSDNIVGQPTIYQWNKIQEKIKELKPATIPTVTRDAQPFKPYWT